MITAGSHAEPLEQRIAQAAERTARGAEFARIVARAKDVFAPVAEAIERAAQSTGDVFRQLGRTIEAARRTFARRVRRVATLRVQRSRARRPRSPRQSCTARRLASASTSRAPSSDDASGAEGAPPRTLDLAGRVRGGDSEHSITTRRRRDDVAAA